MMEKPSHVLIHQACVFVCSFFKQGKTGTGSDAYRRRGGAKVSSSDRYQILMYEKLTYRQYCLEVYMGIAYPLIRMAF